MSLALIGYVFGGSSSFIVCFFMCKYSASLFSVCPYSQMLYKYECYILIIFRHEKIMNVEVLIIWRVNTCYKIFFFHIT